MKEDPFAISTPTSPAEATEAVTNFTIKVTMQFWYAWMMFVPEMVMKYNPYFRPPRP